MSTTLKKTSPQLLGEFLELSMKLNRKWFPKRKDLAELERLGLEVVQSVTKDAADAKAYRAFVGEIESTLASVDFRRGRMH